MSPDHWSKLTWDTVSAGGYDLFDPIGYLDRKRDRAYKQRVIVYVGVIGMQVVPFVPFSDTVGSKLVKIEIQF